MRLVVIGLLAHTVLSTNPAGQAFLDGNKAKPGVITLPSGLQYRVLAFGSGTQHPLKSTECKCHYEGRTAQEFVKSGKTFDSSFKRGEPAAFAPDQVIAGWTEALQLMVAGDQWELYIPSELGYGDSGAGDDIGAGDALIFTLHLLELNGPGKAITSDEVEVRRHRGGRGAKRHGGMGGMGGRGSASSELR